MEDSVVGRLLVVLISVCCLCACSRYPAWLSNQKSQRSVPHYLAVKMAKLNMNRKSPVLLRIFKKESKLEVWKQQRTGEFALLQTYAICNWSGKLGPKFMRYDRQAPEGIYHITVGDMNAGSRYYLAINIGFPNDYDAANGHYGNNLMIHGGCSSSGCYSMTDKNIAEIFGLVRDGFLGGQAQVEIQAYPFEMSAENMAIYHKDNNYSFWKQLKLAYDIFDLTHQPLRYEVYNGHYKFAMPADEEFLNSYNTQQELYERELGIFMRQTRQREPNNPKLQGIKGKAEARLVADWMRKAMAGEVNDYTPPNMQGHFPAS